MDEGEEDGATYCPPRAFTKCKRRKYGSLLTQIPTAVPIIVVRSARLSPDLRSPLVLITRLRAA
jgi:hypothetical protein